MKETKRQYYFIFFLRWLVHSRYAICIYIARDRAVFFFSSVEVNIALVLTAILCECNKTERTYFVLKSKWTFVAATFFFSLPYVIIPLFIIKFQ